MSKRILVVDDEEAIRKSFLLSLEPTGYHVDTAMSGEDALLKMEDVSYDLVYLDLKMPGMGGARTLREIRSTHKKTPVYIVTAFHREFFGELAEIRKEGIPFELLRKPIERDQIIAITKGILEGAVNAE